MTERCFGGDDFEVADLAFLCMTGGDPKPGGLLWGYDVFGKIPGCFDATEEIIIGAIDAPEFSPAGAWWFKDNCLMLGTFAQIVRRPA